MRNSQCQHVRIFCCDPHTEGKYGRLAFLLFISHIHALIVSMHERPIIYRVIFISPRQIRAAPSENILY